MRTTQASWLLTLPAAISIALLAGCSAPGKILQPAPDALRWPAAPDAARLSYLGELRTDKDLKAARGFFESIGSGLFGDEPPEEMASPLAVCTDGASRVFVVDSSSRQLHIFDLDTRKYSTWKSETSPFQVPVAVAFDPSGRVLVADSAQGCLFAFNRDGSLVEKIGVGVLRRPCGIAIAADGRIFVADVGAHQVVILSSGGAEMARIGNRGSGPGEFNFPTNLAFDHQGRLYVSDSMNFRIQLFTPDLKPLKQIGKKGDLPGYFSQPKGVAIDPDDHLYVVDANFEAVQLFDREGALLMSFGHEGSGPGEFWLPAGIHIDPLGRVFVADSYNRRIQVFQYLREGTTP